MLHIHQLLQKNKHLLLVTILSIATHWYIFFDTKNLNSGDWIHVDFPLLKSLWNEKMWLTYFNIGQVMPVPNNLPFYWLASILANVLNINWDVATRILFFSPSVVLTPIFSYKYFEKVFGEESKMPFFASSLYCFNTLFLKFQLDLLTFAAVWAFYPALLLSLESYLSKPRSRHLFFTALLVFVSIIYEIRLFIVICSTIALYIALWICIEKTQFKIKMFRIFGYSVGFISGGLLHAFWILPFVLDRATSKSLLSLYSEVFISFHNVLDALTLHSYQWVNGMVMYPFIKQKVEIHMFLIPLVVIIGFFSSRLLKKNRLHALFFSIIFLVSVFLTKQSNAPFTSVYAYLFKHLPLFNMYRESSKFFHPLALSLSFFFALGLDFLFKSIGTFSKKSAILVVFTILFISTYFNTRLFINQTVGGMTKGQDIPQNVQLINDYINSDSQPSRLLWFMYSRFGHQSYVHPSILDIHSLFRLQFNDGKYHYDMKYIDEVLTGERFKIVLEELNIKYLILPVAEKFEKHAGKEGTYMTSNYKELYGDNDQEDVAKIVNKLSYLKRVKIIGESYIYENLSFQPKIRLKKGVSPSDESKLKFVQNSSSSYAVSLTNHSQISSSQLVFSETYHYGWKVAGCAHMYFWQKIANYNKCYLSDSFHTKSNFGLNVFEINPAVMCRMPGVCKPNGSGTYDLNFELFFYPDNYLYIGLFISAISICLNGIVAIVLHRSSSIMGSRGGEVK